MTKRTKIATLIFSISLLIIGGALFFIYLFLSALTVPKVLVTANYISTNHDFTNGITIEKITVDSIGSKNYPVKYTVNYRTSCFIEHSTDKSLNAPDKIYFEKEGDYWWAEENLSIPYIHENLSRHITGSTNKSHSTVNKKRLKICPMRFEKEHWYFITVGNPQVTGIFFLIDKQGIEHQYFLASGISPI